MSNLPSEFEEAGLAVMEAIENLDAEQALSALCMALATSITLRYPIQEWGQRANIARQKVNEAIKAIPSIHRGMRRWAKRFTPPPKPSKRPSNHSARTPACPCCLSS